MIKKRDFYGKPQPSGLNGTHPATLLVKSHSNLLWRSVSVFGRFLCEAIVIAAPDTNPSGISNPVRVPSVAPFRSYCCFACQRWVSFVYRLIDTTLRGPILLFIEVFASPGVGGLPSESGPEWPG